MSAGQVCDNDNDSVIRGQFCHNFHGKGRKQNESPREYIIYTGEVKLPESPLELIIIIPACVIALKFKISLFYGRLEL